MAQGKWNDASLGEIRASLKIAANAELAHSIWGLLTWCQYERFQAHGWALRLIKADPKTGEDAAAALTNFDHMIEGAKASYRDNPVERRRYDAVIEAFLAWKAASSETAGQADASAA